MLIDRCAMCVCCVLVFLFATWPDIGCIYTSRYIYIYPRRSQTSHQKLVVLVGEFGGAAEHIQLTFQMGLLRVALYQILKMFSLNRKVLHIFKGAGKCIVFCKFSTECNLQQFCKLHNTSSIMTFCAAGYLFFYWPDPDFLRLFIFFDHSNS